MKNCILAAFINCLLLQSIILCAAAEDQRELPNALVLQSESSLQLFQIKQENQSIQFAKSIKYSNADIIKAIIGHNGITLLVHTRQTGDTRKLRIWKLSILNPSFVTRKFINIQSAQTPRIFLTKKGYVAQLDNRIVFFNKSLEETESIDLLSYPELFNQYNVIPELIQVENDNLYIRNKFLGSYDGGWPRYNSEILKLDPTETSPSKRFQPIISEERDKASLRQTFIDHKSGEWFGLFSEPPPASKNCYILRIPPNPTEPSEIVLKFYDALPPLFPWSKPDCGDATVFKFGKIFWQLGKSRAPILNPLSPSENSLSSIPDYTTKETNSNYLVQRIDDSTVALLEGGTFFIFDMLPAPRLLIRGDAGFDRIAAFCNVFTDVKDFSIGKLSFNANLYSTAEKKVFQNLIHSPDFCEIIESIRAIPILQLNPQLTKNLLINAGLGKDGNVLNCNLLQSSIAALKQLALQEVDILDLFSKFAETHPEHLWKVKSLQSNECRHHGSIFRRL